MIYSYTQIAHYLRCPRSYRYRYLDGWREKDSPGGLLFGRCFEKALGPISTVTIVARHFIKNGMSSWRKDSPTAGGKHTTAWPSTKI